MASSAKNINNPRAIGVGDVVRVNNEYAIFKAKTSRYKVIGTMGNQLKMTAVDINGLPEKWAYAFEVSRVPIRKTA